MSEMTVVTKLAVSIHVSVTHCGLVSTSVPLPSAAFAEIVDAVSVKAGSVGTARPAHKLGTQRPLVVRIVVGQAAKFLHGVGLAAVLRW